MAKKQSLLDRTESSIITAAVGMWLDRVAAESRPSELAMTKATVIAMLDKLGVGHPPQLTSARPGPLPPGRSRV